MSNYNDRKIYMNSTMHHYSPKRVISMAKKAPFEDNEINIVGTRPAITRKFSSIGRHI